MTAPAEGRVALVTGGARGIGFAIAQALAGMGMRVALADLLDDTQASASSLSADASRALALQCDVSSEEACQRTVARAAEWGGRLDVLVNCAGITIKRGPDRFPTEETSLADWERTLRINLTGTFLMVRAAIAPMKANRWGRIINIASQAGRANSRFSGSAYAASKAGIIGFSRILAGELGPHGITVNSIAPGRILSAMNAVSAGANEGLLAQIPMARIGTGEDVAGAAAYLASEQAQYVTGTVIDVNGGTYMV